MGADEVLSGPSLGSYVGRYLGIGLDGAFGDGPDLDVVVRVFCGDEG